MPAHVPENEDKVEKLSPEEATKAVLEAEYAVSDIGVDEQDALGLEAGTAVAVEATE
jgi:hypothetical protein